MFAWFHVCDGLRYAQPIPRPLEMGRVSLRAHRVAVRLEPGQPAFEKALAYALNTVGVALRTGKQFRAALTNCQEALRLAPDIPSTWSNLGNVLKDLKYIKSAIACHKRAVALAPQSSDCLFNLAVAYSAGMHSRNLPIGMVSTSI